MSRFNRIPSLLLLGLLSFQAQAAGQKVSEDGRRSISPEIAVGGDGAINLIWLDKGLTKDRPKPKKRKPGEHSHRSATNLFFSRSEDGGESWSKPIQVNPEDGGVWGFAVSKPRIDVGPTGTIHVFYPANDRSEKIGRDVVSARYTRSTDNGKSFSQPIVLNRPVEKDRSELLGEGLGMTNSFGTMGVGPDGTVIAAWQDVADMRDSGAGANGAVAISRDDGVSFEEERIALPGNAVCPCCQFTIAFGAEDAFFGYRKIYSDGRDSTVARFSNGGVDLVGEGRLDLERWDINGCPLKPTELAIDGDNVYAATYTGGEPKPALYFSRSTDGGATFSGKRQVHPEAPYSDAPELTVDSDGAVRLVWHAKVEGPRGLYTAVSVDGGETLSAPEAIETPSGAAANPATDVAVDGTVYVTWQHANEEVFVTSLPAPKTTLANR